MRLPLPEKGPQRDALRLAALYILKLAVANIDADAIRDC